MREFITRSRLLALLAAMLCKPSAMIVPVILIVLDRFFLHRSWRKIVLAVLPMACVIVPLMVVARKVQDADAVPPVAPIDRFFVAGDALTFYLQKLLIPIRLCVDYGRSPTAAMQMPGFKLGWLLPIVIAVGLFLCRKRVPKLLAAAIIFLAPLLPVLGFTPFMFQAHSTVADHYLYLPMLGGALAVAILVAYTKRAIPVILVVAVIFILLSNLQSRTWADSLAPSFPGRQSQSEQFPRAGKSRQRACLARRFCRRGFASPASDPDRSEESPATPDPGAD